MKNIRIIFGSIALFTIVLLVSFYFGGYESISSIVGQDKMNSPSIMSTSVSYSVASIKESIPKNINSTSLLNLHNGYDSEMDAGCKLPNLDPWDPSVLPFIEKDYNPMKGCEPIAEIRTALEDGVLMQAPSDDDFLCWYRCILPDTDWEVKMEKWQFLNISAVPNCEFVETHCTTLGTSGNITYKRLHHQIIPLPDLKVDNNNNIRKPMQPSVFVLGFDSVSRSSGIRSLPETFQVLSYMYRVFDFRGLNKVGKNTLPNVHAFLNGEYFIPYFK